jgi:hypothetical protein
MSFDCCIPRSSFNPYSTTSDHLTTGPASLDTVNITSPKPESLPTPPWFIDRLSEDIPPNPPNSPVHFPQEILPPTTVYHPQCLDIWFMSSEPSHPVCDISSTSSPLEDNHTLTITHVTSPDPLYSRIFHCDEDILEELTTLDFPWNALHHQALFLSQEAFDPPSQASICAIETKDFIPSGHIDWFNNPIPAPDAFEEGNMANISPTIKINISIKPRIIEEITIGIACSPEELTTYKSLFQEYRDIFSWSYTEMPGLDPSIVEHRIDTWPDVTPVHQKKHPLHPSKAVAIKAKLTSYALLGSFTPLCIPHGFPTPSPLTKNRALFTSAPTFMISTMLVPKTTFQPLSSTKLSMTVPATRLCPSWMGSPATIKSKSIQQISIKPLLLPHGVLFLIVSCLLDSRT